MNSSATPLVSICMITYNHEPYIAQAIESVLMQKCNFAFELVIGEDCSTDATLKICQKFALNHSHIRLLPSSSNLGMIHNFIRTLEACNGKYIAICEGDDYWTDPYKLQKQVDFLEANEDFGLVHTNYVRYNNALNYFEDNFTRKIDIGNIFKELLRENQIATLTVMMRRNLAIDAINAVILEKDALIGDYPLWLQISLNSKIGYLEDITSVYRVLSESASNTRDIDKQVCLEKYVFEVKRYFAEKYKSEDTIMEQEILLYRHFLYLGYKNLRSDIATEAFSFLKKHNGYKVRIIDYLYYLSTFNPKIHYLTALIKYIKSRVND